VTPKMLTLGPNALHRPLPALSFVGLGWAWTVYRTRDRQNVFDTETQVDTQRNEVDEPEGAAR